MEITYLLRESLAVAELREYFAKVNTTRANRGLTLLDGRIGNVRVVELRKAWYSIRKSPAVVVSGSTKGCEIAEEILDAALGDKIVRKEKMPKVVDSLLDTLDS